MPKRLLRKLLPDHRRIREHPHLSRFGARLHDPNLWHLNRRSVAGGTALGLFTSMIPFPGQMIIAAALAIWVRVNLPLSVALVWLTNPLTMPPIYFFAYKVGAWVLGRAPRDVNFELSVKWVGEELATIWEPFLLGCFICGVLAAALGYGAVRLLWRWQVIHTWELRKERRRKAR